jgi:acetoacetate decarboxylase
MGFVKTPEEIARIEVPLRLPRFVNAQMLSVDVLVDPDWVAAVLPPPLEPTDEARVTVMVGRWQSNCVGDYDGGAIYVAARHGDVLADYVLAMWMNTDRALIYGRDLFGEPKKFGTSALHRGGDRLNGWVERNGTRLLEIDVELEQDAGPTQVSGANFNFKARPSATGVGLEEDAILTVATFENELTVNAQGRGAVKLQGTIHDPLDEIEIREVVRGAYVEGKLISQCHVAATVPADVFLPYAYGRMDDWSALDTETQVPLPA